MDDLVRKEHIQIVNQIFDLEKKILKQKEIASTQRNFRRIRDSLGKLGLTYHDPTGEAYDETRTDCEASISGDSAQGLYINETLKPIVRLNEEGFVKIIQRAIVIVGQKEGNEG